MRGGGDFWVWIPGFVVFGGSVVIGFRYMGNGNRIV
jgi:hypothetical protein